MIGSPPKAALSGFSALFKTARDFPANSRSFSRVFAASYSSRQVFRSRAFLATGLWPLFGIQPKSMHKLLKVNALYGASDGIRTHDLLFTKNRKTGVIVCYKMLVINRLWRIQRLVVWPLN